MTIVRKINDYLRKYPFVRNFIIKVIRYNQYYVASLKRVINRTPDGFINNFRRLTPKGENCYFGYYDKSPYSVDGKYLIYHSIPAMKAPRQQEVAKIYIQSMEDGTRRCIGESLAWNLQQGAMLRHIDSQTVAWNDFRKNEYCTVFYNFIDASERVVPCPLYDVDSSKRYGLSLEFERLNVDAEGYGYIQQGLTQFDLPAEIYFVDIATGAKKTIIDSKHLNEMYPIPHKDVDFFYFNHLNFNPSGTRFLFIERYVYQRQRYSRLFSADICGQNIHLLADEKMVSHFTWLDDDKVMLYCTHDGQNAYYCFEDIEGHTFQMLEHPKLFVDGHPTFIKDERTLFVSDTYPDNSRRRHLFTYDIEQNKYKELAALKAPIKYDGPVRCDLHPRLRPDMKAVCVDSIHEGFRGIYEIEL